MRGAGYVLPINDSLPVSNLHVLFRLCCRVLEAMRPRFKDRLVIKCKVIVYYEKGEVDEEVRKHKGGKRIRQSSRESSRKSEKETAN